VRAEVAHWIAAALFTAAGRQADEPEFTVWESGLATTPEDGYEDVVQTIIASVDFAGRPPTVAMFHEHRRGLMNRERAPHSCPCLGSGLVEVDGQADAWRPCGRCNPAGYERWKKGRFRSKFAGTDPEAADKVAAMRLQLPDPNGGEW
jgi:hypothetical protein